MPPGDVTSLLEELSARVEELERRLSALEQSGRAPGVPSEPDTAGVSFHLGTQEAPPAEVQPSVFSIFGKAILGIAGAYLLRAGAEAGTLPSWISVTLGLAYACGWLAWAAWPGTQTRLARYFYAISAALILTPMLWEVTVRFRMLEPRATAAIIAAFALLATMLAWRMQISPVLWVGMLTAVFSCLGLMVGTRALVPFAWSLLAVGALCEIAASRGRWGALRPVVAAGADLGIVLVIAILGDWRTIPSEYQPVGTGILTALVAVLFTIYAASMALRSLVFRRNVSAMDAAQFAASALLAGWAVLRITDGAGKGALGICCLLLGAGGYWASHAVVAQGRARRNFHFYATCALLLVMVGSFFILPPALLVIWLSLAAVAGTVLGVRLRSEPLGLHGMTYLSGAASASGLLVYARGALAGSYPAFPGPLPFLVAVAAILCAAIVSRSPGQHLAERVLRVLPAILAVLACAAFAVTALVWLISRGAEPSPPQLAVIRTTATGAAALLLTFAGARFRQAEFVWMAYAAVGLGFLKLVFEDLRVGSARSLASSLLIYGAVLILLPRVTRAPVRRN